MTDLTKGKVFDRVSMTWVDRTAYERRRAELEERAFQRQPSQGRLCAPMILMDTTSPVQSMTNGKVYDSKSELRKEYRRAGVIEVGNEGKALRGLREKTRKEKDAQRQKDVHAAVERGLSQAGLGA